MALFIGLKQKAGDYEIEDEKTKKVKTGDYHNFYMHYVDEAETSGANLVDTGKYETFIAKIKADDISGVFCFDVQESAQLDDWYLKPIDVLFNRKGNIVSVRLLDDTAAKKTKGA